ncbi:hypothetical protein C8Q76DRAFT_613322, partial [Earliella scabrosa]
PDWLRDALDYFELFDAGGRAWFDLVNKWQAFEMHMGYPDEQNRLPPAHRPQEVGAWMKDGRSYEKLPEINPDEFPPRWKAWWSSLQPACRITDVSAWPLSRVVPQSRNEWTMLWRGGQCGLFLAVMALAWWLGAVIEAGESLEDVFSAIADVSWVLDAAGEAHNLKRAAEDGVDSMPAKRVHVK